MGMFDEIVYEDVVYQTKSLARVMDRFVVENNKLFRKVRFFVETPRPPGVDIFDWWKDPQNISEEIYTDLIEQRAHGVIEIHNYDPDKKPPDTQGYLKFTDGELVEVTWHSEDEKQRRLTSGAQVMDDPTQIDDWKAKVQAWKDQHLQQWLDDHQVLEDLPLEES